MMISKIVSLLIICLFSLTYTSILAQALDLPQHKDLLESHPFYNDEVFFFTDTTLNGSNFNFEDYKDHIILLQFWSLRCAVCFKEIPELNLIAEEYKDKKVLVISLMDDSISNLNDRIIKNGDFYRLVKPVFGNQKINFEIIPAARDIMLKYKHEKIPFGFPTTYIIKDGLLKDFSFGYVASYGNPSANESKNYQHLKKLIDRELPKTEQVD